ncbi:sodium- and chloride-dependent creatine transporter 1-like [Symsagittifera roscoffensis]|uniref:sodium- and chloride-dependent creatine transporter 1-like n=1 Tax=Symsagittifera roscoffensis TaxID=84072 RepID=UPI00307B8085
MTVGKDGVDCKKEDEDSAKVIDRQGRETWKGSFDFLMTLIGFSVGIGNLWRFPYLCYKNGGGVFLIPYFITLFGAGVPLIFLEVSLGQFMSKSGTSAWNLFPLAKGLGVATLIIVSNLSLYYIVVIAWTVYYLYSTFTLGDLPWTKCADPNGTVCRDYQSLVDQSESSSNVSYQEPAEYFWEHNVLRLSDSMEIGGTVQPHMVISLAVSWLIVYICIVRGVQWTGKIVWFTGLFPYVMLVILFLRGITLNGAMSGIVYYLKPDLSKLTEGGVWLDAGTQILFSMSLGTGTMPTLGSYNKFTHNCLKDAILFSVINCLTSIFGGVCIFSVLGYMAYERNIPISEVAEGGPGLTFIAYPKALSLMPFGAKLLTGAFFLMILFLGLDSQFVGVEGLVSQFMDAFPNRYFRHKHARSILITIICALWFVIGIVFATNSGMYYFQIMDFYSASGFVLLFVGLGEAIAIAYCYGGKRYVKDLEAMMKIRIPKYFLFCWYFFTPFTCISIGVMYWIKLEPLSYHNYTYPLWSAFLGWTIVIFTVGAIPLTAIVQICRHRNNIADVKRAVLREHQIHPGSEQPYEVIQREISAISDSFPAIDLHGQDDIPPLVQCKPPQYISAV